VGWHSVTTLTLFAVAMLALISFVIYELRPRGTLARRSVFANRTFSASAGAIAVTTSPSLGSFFSSLSTSSSFGGTPPFPRYSHAALCRRGYGGDPYRSDYFAQSCARYVVATGC